MSETTYKPSTLKQRVCILRRIVRESKNEDSKYRAIKRLGSIGENCWDTFDNTQNTEYLGVAIKAFSALGPTENYDNLINFVQEASRQGYKWECSKYLRKYKGKYKIPRKVIKEIRREAPRDIEAVYAPPLKFTERPLVKVATSVRKEKAEQSFTEKILSRFL